MPAENVMLKIGGKEYTGWKSVLVRRSVEALAASFDVDVRAFQGTPAEILPGDSVEVFAGKDRLLTGYVDEISQEVDSGERVVTITGRGKTADLVDCSATNKPVTWKGSQKISKIVKDLVTPFGIGLSIESIHADKTTKNFSITTGESPADAINRLCGNRAILPVETAAGNLNLTNLGDIHSVDSLVYGKNVLSASVKVSNAERFYKYIVRGEGGGGGSGWDTTAAFTIEGSAIDSEILRKARVKVFKDTDSTSVKSMKTRAAWEAQVRRGNGIEVTVDIVGWRQSDKSLWRENLLVPIYIAPIGISGSEMLLAGVEYSQGEDGTMLKMTLKQADTFAAEPKADAKKATNNLGWGSGGAAETPVVPEEVDEQP